MELLRGLIMCVAVSIAVMASGVRVTEKLDPNLKARVEAGSGAEAGDVVEVLIGLDRSASDGELAALKAAGLTVRSVIGDVLTGTVPVAAVAAVAAHPRVVKIEASGSLQPERPPTD